MIDLRSAKGVLTLGAGEVLARAIAFIGTAILTRRLGPDGFGVLAFATAMCGYFALVVNAGLGEAGAREAARNPGNASSIYGTVVHARLVLGLAAFCVLALVVAYLPRPDTVKVVIFVTALTFVSLAFDPSWLYRALEKRGIAASGQVLTQVIYVAAVVTLVEGADDVRFAPIAQFCGEFIVAAVLAVPFMGSLRQWQPASVLQLLRSTGYLSAARMMRLIIITFDVLFLGFVATSTSVGLYTASYRVAFLLMAIGTAASSAYLPTLVRAQQQDAQVVAERLLDSIRTSLYLGLPLAVGGAVTAGALLAALFGSDFAVAGPVLVLHMTAMGCFLVHAMYSNVFLVTHRTRLQARIYAVAATLNVAANVVLIPRFGIVGAAAATLLAEATITLLSIYHGARSAGIRLRLAPLLTPLLLATSMGAIVLLSRPWLGLAGQVLLGASSYGIALLLVHARLSRRSTT